MPVSLEHPHLLRLLQVGRNDGEGYFYYVMELADDQQTGQQIDEVTYKVRDLGWEFVKQGEADQVLGGSLRSVWRFWRASSKRIASSSRRTGSQ